MLAATIVAQDLQNTKTSSPLWSFSTGGEPLPASPSSLQIQEPNSAIVELGWSDQSTNEVGFKVGRKLSGQDNYTQVAVVQADSTEYLDQSGLLGDSTYNYAVRSYNASGNSNYSNEAHVVAPRVSFYDFAISDGAWYMISLPLTPFDNLVANIFPTALAGDAFIWNGDDYIPIQNIDPQNGYWLPIPDSWFGDIAGYGVFEYTVHFPKRGWYMIGGVVDAVDFSGPNDSPDNSVITPAYGYDPYSKNYYHTDVIESKSGYWVAVLQECDLNIGGEPLGPTMEKPFTSPFTMTEKEFFIIYGSSPPPPPDLNWETGELVEIPKEFTL